MLFRTFRSQEERRRFGGSDFVELQYCSKELTALKDLVSADNISHWRNDSLYVLGDDLELFLSLYGEIFQGGIHNDGMSGMLDTCGINYYSKDKTRLIAEKIAQCNSAERDVLLHWLENANNGFYVLGV